MEHVISTELVKDTALNVDMNVCLKVHFQIVTKISFQFTYAYT